MLKKWHFDPNSINGQIIESCPSVRYIYGQNGIKCSELDLMDNLDKR